jgi:L-alanine-DL-glutamate epimerase-like enolase superfamily enzyme
VPRISIFERSDWPIPNSPLCFSQPNRIDVPTLMGEDVYLAESHRPLCPARVVDFIHPAPQVTCGLLEPMKMVDMAQEYGVGMMVYWAACPAASILALIKE